MLDDNWEDVFVDREEELGFLERVFSLFRKGLANGVLVYGLRRVGKTRLIMRFLENKKHVVINCGGFGSVNSFFWEAVSIVRHKFGFQERVMKWVGYFDEAPMEKLKFKRAFEFLADVSEEISPMVVFLDEFHMFLDKLALRVAREEKTNSKRALLDLFWIMKDVMERSKIFWILASSTGWEKLREFLQMKTREAPLLGVLDRLEVKPLDFESSVELAERIMIEPDRATAEEIAKLSGGIPKLVIEIANKIIPGESPLKLALKLLEKGIFDDVFDNIVRLAAELTKFEYTTIMNVLLLISEEKRTAKEISTYMGMSPVVISAIIKELEKISLIEKTETRPQRFKIRYPLLEAWIEMRLKDRKLEDKIRRALTTLGITAESYVRELFLHITGKKVELWDDKVGKFLAGTKERIVLHIEKVYSKKETDEYFAKKGVKNGDIIAETKEGLLIAEVKAGIKNIEPDVVHKIKGVVDKLGEKEKRKITPILIHLGEGEIEPKTAIEAKNNNITIITKEGIKKLAKKTNFPPI
ncbi:MAG: ATP-binding protein [Candidatus Njordarchaeia archaeon]